MKPHWPAICRSLDNTPFLTNTLYPDEATARADLPGVKFVRLATELPALPLEALPKKTAEDYEREKRQRFYDEKNAKPAPTTQSKHAGKGFDWKTGKLK